MAPLFKAQVTSFCGKMLFAYLQRWNDITVPTMSFQRANATGTSEALLWAVFCRISVRGRWCAVYWCSSFQPSFWTMFEHFLFSSVLGLVKKKSFWKSSCVLFNLRLLMAPRERPNHEIPGPKIWALQLCCSFSCPSSTFLHHYWVTRGRF